MVHARAAVTRFPAPAHTARNGPTAAIVPIAARLPQGLAILGLADTLTVHANILRPATFAARLATTVVTTLFARARGATILRTRALVFAVVALTVGAPGQTQPGIAIGIAVANPTLTTTTVGTALLAVACRLTNTLTTNANMLRIQERAGGIVRQILILATRGRVTRVSGADVAVAALEKLARNTPSARTFVLNRAHIAVIAREGVGVKNAAGFRVAGIIGAQVAVITGQTSGRDALAQVTMVPGAAQVSVITRRYAKRRYATQKGVAMIVRAWIVVLAVLRPGPDAEPIIAQVELGAGVAIVTFGPGKTGVCTTALGIAEVGGALVAVVANEFFPSDTSFNRMACFVTITNVEVVAKQSIAGDASQRRVATLDAVADICIVTFQRRATDTTSFQANVRGGANISVIAGLGVVLMGTPCFRVAGIIGANVPIVAIDDGTSGARSVGTLRPGGAGVSVITKKSAVVRHRRALARGRLTVRLEAQGVLPAGLFTFYDRSGVNHALERNLQGIASQRTVTKIAVLQSGAFFIILAVASDLFALAHAGHAMVACGARIPVVAITGNGRIFTPAGFRTHIVGARIVIVTLYRVADTLAFHAVVGHCAGILVTAVPSGEYLVDAALFPSTFIVGAVVSVVTQVDIVTAFQGRLVHLPVAVIVLAVAQFGCRKGRIAKGQAFLFTDPLARAQTVFIGRLAGSPEPQLHRGIRAGALTRVGHTLIQLYTINGYNRLAGETPGAPCSLGRARGTGSTTKTPHFPVVDARILGAGGARAIISLCARPAQVWEIRHAHKDEVGRSARHLGAGPPFRALLLTGLCAHFFAHVLHAPARLAVQVIGTVVRKTPFTGVTG